MRETVASRIDVDRTVSRLEKQGLTIVPPFEITHKKNLKFTPPVYIGPNSYMQLYGELILGEGVIIGPRLSVLTGNHVYEGPTIPYSKEYDIRSVTIGDFVWIGYNVTILPGVTIGEGAVIGACSVVTKDIPPYAVAVGNPAHVVKYRDKECYEKNKNDGKGYLQMKSQNRL